VQIQRLRHCHLGQQQLLHVAIDSGNSCVLLFDPAATLQAILKLHSEWTASNIWEFPRIHMSYTPQVSSTAILPNEG